MGWVASGRSCLCRDGSDARFGHPVVAKEYAKATLGSSPRDRDEARAHQIQTGGAGLGDEVEEGR